MISEHFRNSLRTAARLTRAGQLQQATAAIQRALHGDGPVPPTADQPNTGSSKAQSPAPDNILEGVFESLDPASTADTSTPDHKHWNPEALLQKLGQLLHRQPSPLTPAAPIAPGARFLSLTHSSAAGSREYKLYIPSHYQDGEQNWPLLIMLHGCQQNPDDFAAGSRMNQLAEEFRCLVAYPAQTGSANHFKCWNWFQPADQQRGQGEPAILASLTRELITKYDLNPKQVFIAGLSAGGAMAAVMGANYPELFAAVGVHSGLACGAAQDLPSALLAMRQGSSTQHTLQQSALPALIVFHGEKDNTVNPVNSDQLIAQWKDQEPSAATAPETAISNGQIPGGHAYTRQQIRDKNGNLRLEYWQVHGADHAWAGGSAAGSFTDPRGPDASRAMLQFFYQQSDGPPSARE